jgi:two-component system response regulator BaeR
MAAVRPARVFIVEDEPKIVALLADYLRHEGHAVESFGDGAVALAAARQNPPDLVLLDVMLPGLNGIEVCREIRRFSEVPVLMLTARVDEVDRLLGLDTGADDYVCKPFSPREVTARVRALLRRSRASAGSDGRPWVVDEAGLKIVWKQSVLPLTPVEFRIFARLLAHPGRVYSRAQLLDAVHADLRDVSDRAIDSHVKNLRRKLLAADPAADPIHSVYGVGYPFDPPPEPSGPSEPY